MSINSIAKIRDRQEYHTPVLKGLQTPCNQNPWSDLECLKFHLFTVSGIFSHDCGKNLSVSDLRMRKWRTKTTVPLDAVPERRTERCSPRFRPGGRFWGEPRFRYLSPGSEGEKCRPLDHLWQTPFIHSARYINSSKSHIYRTVFHLSPPFGTFKSVLLRCLFCNCACTFGDQLLQAIIILVFHTVHASAYWHKSKSIYACAFGEQAKLFPRHFRAPSEEINGSNYVGKTAPPQLPAPIIDKLIDIVFLT